MRRRIASDAGRHLPADLGQSTLAMDFNPEFCRQRVLRETLDAFEASDPPDAYHQCAARNLARWRSRAESAPREMVVEVLPLDWGEATSRLTARFGECFAVLNMANPVVPGGAYVEGAPAQEENMFRRTDCHFAIDRSDMRPGEDWYRPEMTRLLEGRDGTVYLDTSSPRVCIRGPEDRSAPGLGYRWLAEDEVFPFFELRSAAVSRSDGRPFDEIEMRRRIVAQLETLQAAGIRHAVLGAFGCGAFGNPAERVAAIYRSELQRRSAAFSVIAFAVFHAGYGRDNFAPFAAEFGGVARH